MAYNNEIRAKARDYYEIHEKKLQDISEILKVPVSTLSEWKNDETQPYGTWKKGRLKNRIDETAQKFHDELKKNPVYEEIVTQIKKELRIERYNKTGHYLVHESEDEKVARVHAETIMLNAISQEHFDTKAYAALEVADQILNDIKKNPETAKMSDVKTYIESVRMVKEMRYGKSPEVVFFNQNNGGAFSDKDLANMSEEQLRALIQQKKNEQKVIEAKEALAIFGNSEG